MGSINTILSSAAAAPVYTPAAKPAAALAAATDSLPAPAPVPYLPVQPVPQASQSELDDAARESAVREAALSFKNTYAISDQSFSIFKDASGKYITRYVSLRDGTITYVPEPTLQRHIQPATEAAPQIAIHA
jgi:hypothetical protein